ncbi:unnamed protein product [Sphagnum jensenii]|uniref:Uncharacterized protein n=1 Tax=Sphagnum jensenii TaxID=128206 RepID=A0ABP0WI32_9BRYO
MLERPMIAEYNGKKPQARMGRSTRSEYSSLTSGAQPRGKKKRTFWGRPSFKRRLGAAWPDIRPRNSSRTTSRIYGGR